MMKGRLFGMLALFAGLLMIGTVLWPFPHSRAIALVCAVIVGAHALYALRSRNES